MRQVDAELVEHSFAGDDLAGRSARLRDRAETARSDMVSASFLAYAAPSGGRKGGGPAQWSVQERQCEPLIGR